MTVFTSVYMSLKKIDVVLPEYVFLDPDDIDDLSRSGFLRDIRNRSTTRVI